MVTAARGFGGGGALHGGGGYHGGAAPHYHHGGGVYGRDLSPRGWRGPGGFFFTTPFLLSLLGTWMFFEYVDAERVNFEITAENEVAMRREIAELKTRPESQQLMRANPGVRLVPDVMNNRYVFARETSAPQ